MVAFSRLSAGLVALAVPALGRVVLESVKSVPSDWTLVDSADSSATITLSVALARQNLDQLEAKLLALSTPGKATYGQWLDLDDINEQFPLADETAVVSWLKEAGVTQIAREGGLLNFATTVGTANQLLNTTFSVYKSGSTQKVRTTQYSIPDRLTGTIDLISPTVFFGKSNAARSAAVRASQIPKDSTRSSSSDVCEYITPACLKEQYSIDYTPEASSGSRVGFGSFLGESALYSDLDLFTQYFDIAEQNFTVVTINGGINNQEDDPDGEADLDVENIVGISHPLPVTEYITGGSP